ncbi:putative toxin-antitoxin system toxin component, PIN family [Undibacterium sp.]|uniref:putative toxin-antitoxin system toxin component, PIN family n=1 Tax=Undibacterium sp. TaxID=1914977 RepID=UPI003752987B
MPKPATYTLRVVLDTNVLLSALVFTGGTMARFRGLWESGKITPYTSKEATKELMRVLAYKKFKLSSQDQDGLLADYLPYAQVADVLFVVPPSLPICRDPLDQMFLKLTAASKSDVLITGDQDLLVLANEPNLSFQILKPVDFLKQYQFLPM